MGEWVVDEEVGNREEARIMREFVAVLLQGAEVVRIAKLVAQAFEDPPVLIGVFGSDVVQEVVLEVGGDAIVVEQGVVNVEEKNDFGAGSRGRSPARNGFGFHEGQ